MLAWKKSSLPAGLMNLCFLPTLSALRPQSPWKMRVALCSRMSSRRLSCSHSVPAELNLFICLGKWDRQPNALSYFSAGFQPYLFIHYFLVSFVLYYLFPSGFFPYSIAGESLWLCGDLVNQPTHRPDSKLLQTMPGALFGILNGFCCCVVSESGQLACNCEYLIAYFCSGCCPYHSCNVQIRESVSV